MQQFLDQIEHSVGVFYSMQDSHDIVFFCRYFTNHVMIFQEDSIKFGNRLKFDNCS